MRRRWLCRILHQGIFPRPDATFCQGSGCGFRAYRTVKLKVGDPIPPQGFLALNELRDNDGSRKPKTRLGRGIGSGKGKTAGRGHKGQKARGRNPREGFEGGQTPLRLRIPKRGFNNKFGTSFQPVNLETITDLVAKGSIDASQLVSMKVLKDVGALGKQSKDGVKLLAKGSAKFSLPVNFEVSRVSERAKAAVEAAGGSVTRVHYNKLGLKALLDPGWFESKGRLLPQPARPPLKVIPKVDATGRLPAPLTPLPVSVPESAPK